MKAVRIVILTLVVVGCIGLSAGSYHLGERSAEKKTVTEAGKQGEGKVTIQEEDTADKGSASQSGQIAVVNLDLGANRGGDRIYYSTRLIEDSRNDVEMTSLENARNGITDGTYAAYIVIPSDFSECVVSVLNQTPQRASLRYEFNQNLTASDKEQAINDVQTFYRTLNDSVEYMYVDSILAGFHEAQDTAVEIMENDEKDNEAIAALRADDLTSLLTIAPAENAMITREGLDISGFTETQRGAANSLQDIYENAASRINAQSEEVRSRGEALDTDIAGITDAFSNVRFSDQTKADLKTFLMQEGTAYDEKLNTFETGLRDLLKEAHRNNVLSMEVVDGVLTYNEKLPEAKNALAERLLEEIENAKQSHSITIESGGSDLLLISTGEGADASRVEIPYLEVEETDPEDGEQSSQYIVDEEELAARLQNAVNEQLTAAEAGEEQAPGRAQVEAIIEEQIQPVQAEYSYQENANSEEEKVSLEGLRESLTNEETKLAPYLMSDEDGAVPQPIIERFDWGGLAERLEQTYSKDVENAGSDVDAAVQTGRQSIQTFLETLGTFRPESEVSQTDLMTQQNEMQRSAALLEQAVARRDAASEERLAEINEANSKNIESLRTTLEELNEASNERVTSGLAEIKQQKEETTAANRESLTALTQQLPYTRLGSLAYTEAYQFMVSPTTIEERDSKKTAQADINVQGANEPPAVQNEGVLETKDDSIAGFLYLLLAAAAGVAIILVARIAMQSNRVK